MEFNPRLGWTVLGAFVAVTAPGCIVRTPGVQTSTPAGTVQVQGSVPVQNVQVQTPELGSGVQVVEMTCQQGAAETCNGLDDNCNGQIDEGCGYSSGSIQITLSWATGADLDLHVTDPNGDTLGYDNPQVSSGGFLDQDARGACRQATANNTIENVYWNSSTPPPGNYRVEVHYYNDCGTGEAPAPATVSIAVGGQVWRSLQTTLMPNQRQAVATFTL